MSGENDSVINRLLEAGDITPNVAKDRCRQVHRYERWVAIQAAAGIDWLAWPAEPVVVAACLAHISEHSRTAGYAVIMEQTLHWWAQTHDLRSHRDHPDGDTVALVVDGIRRRLADGRQPAPPLLRQDIQRILSLEGPCRRDALWRHHRDLALTALMACTGLRAESVATLHPSDWRAVDVEGGDAAAVWVQRDKTDQEGRGRLVEVRRDHLAPFDAVRIVDDWVAMHAGTCTSPMLFPGKLDSPKPMTTAVIIGIVKRLAARAGLDVIPTSHSLRRGLVTQAVRDGARLEDIAAHIGHRRISTTARYAAPSDGVVTDAIGTSVRDAQIADADTN